MTERAIVAEGLLKRYGKVTALRDTSFAVTKGTITGFIGRNGAGKTTTLKIVSTLMDADDGACHVLGDDVRKKPYAIRARLGFLPDTFELPPTITLREGKPITLQNTADGSRFTIELLPQGTAAPAAGASGSSTVPASTTPATTSTGP